MRRQRPKTDRQNADAWRRHQEAWDFNPTAPGVDCRVSANVGDLMAAAMAAAGCHALRMGGKTACETDYLAASGAVFPNVAYEEMIAFNRSTMRAVMDEDAEFERYRRIALFFRRGT